MQAIHNNNNQYSSRGVTDALQRAWKSLPLLPCYCCLSSPPLFSLHLLPGMCLAQPMITTSSRSARSQRVVSVRWAVSGCRGSGMANNFSGSATRRWDTMMLEESMSQKQTKNDALITVYVQTCWYPQHQHCHYLNKRIQLYFEHDDLHYSSLYYTQRFMYSI